MMMVMEVIWGDDFDNVFKAHNSRVWGGAKVFQNDRQVPIYTMFQNSMNDNIPARKKDAFIMEASINDVRI